VKADDAWTAVEKERWKRGWRVGARRGEGGGGGSACWRLVEGDTHHDTNELALVLDEEATGRDHQQGCHEGPGVGLPW